MQNHILSQLQKTGDVFVKGFILANKNLLLLLPFLLMSLSHRLWLNPGRESPILLTVFILQNLVMILLLTAYSFTVPAFLLSPRVSLQSMLKGVLHNLRRLIPYFIAFVLSALVLRIAYVFVPFLFLQEASFSDFEVISQRMVTVSYVFLFLSFITAVIFLLVPAYFSLEKLNIFLSIWRSIRFFFNNKFWFVVLLTMCVGISLLTGSIPARSLLSINWYTLLKLFTDYLQFILLCIALEMYLSRVSPPTAPDLEPLPEIVPTNETPTFPEIAPQTQREPVDTNILR